MKIELRNIGTIKQAEIDLDKNLLIFCGPNNTGKTYVAYTLYGLYDNQLDLTKKNDLIENIIASSFSEGEMVFLFETDVVNTILAEKEVECTNELSNVFATTQAFFSSASVAISSSTEEIIKKIRELTFQSSFSTTYYNCTITKIPGSDTASIKTIKKEQEVPQDDLQNTYEFIASIIKRAILRAFLKDRYIAPAERIAINIFSKELSLNRNEIVDSIVETADPITGLNDRLKKLKRYSLPIRDSIKVAEDLSNLQKYRSDYYFLAEQIEQKILKGKIKVSANGDMQFSPNDVGINSLDIHLSASMVKSLSSLVFYFRHLAVKGDFIIIDEPELNLHPDNQIIMARILARIVNEGFKVLISTHSDYIIKELNNLVRLNSKREIANEIMERYGYDEKELLAQDTLGVYLFKNNTAISLEVDELGFDISTIEKVNSELSQISESIYFELMDKDDE